LTIHFRPAIDDDFHLAFKIKKQAMGQHIKAKWGWDEAFQLEFHRIRWNEKPWFIILFDEEEVGTISLHPLDGNKVRVGEFYLCDGMRDKGLGSAVLKQVLSESDRKGQIVVLEVLKWNPAKLFYERHGFNVTSENDIHLFMQRKSKLS